MNILGQLKTSLSDRYEMEREIGAGGMATVYLARDLRHDRPVAVKVLNPDLGAVLGIERFLAEIKVTANLQHPNLLPLFDSGEAGGLLFYVMPFVDGESLRAKLMREKQLPIDEAVRIAVAIASALDYAHSHGVIHRDLKPENILIQSGQPVIADFGIALAVSKAGGNRVTQTGISLGTPQYMSPEQATGDRVIDGRSDIYSLAAMTYEMLTGEAPHQGNTAQAIIARVLTEKPRSIRLARESVPEHVAAAVEHGLEKLAADRYSTAREFGEAIQGRGVTRSHTAALPAAVRAGSRWRDPVVITLAGVAVAAVVAGAVLSKRSAPPEATPPFQFVLWTPDSLRPVQPTPWPAAISPDGSMMVYSAGTNSALNFFAVRTDQLEPHLIPGTINGTQPTFSPDGMWLAFEAAGKEKKIRLDGSASVTIADGGANNGADWTINDELVVGATRDHHGLSRVSIAGGTLTEFTHPDRSKGVRDHVWPVSSPDGKTVAFTIWTGSLAAMEVAATHIADGREVPLGIKGIRPLAILDGSLVYVQEDGAVMAVPFDEGKLKVGPPIPVHDPVAVPAGNNGNSDVFISRGGAMVSARGGISNRMVWLDRHGVERPVSNEIRSFSVPRLSPDGKRIAVLVNNGQRGDVWIYEIATGTLSRLTSMETVSYYEWTNDGKYIVFCAAGHSETRNAVWMQLAAGGAPPTRLGGSDELSPIATRSADGSIVVQSLHDNQWDLVRLSSGPGKAAQPYLSSSAQEAGPRFSPNGRWIAYGSDESNGFEIFVRSFPDPSSRAQVSVSGALAFPTWSRDGQFLYYGTGTAIMRARISESPAISVLGRDTVVSLPANSHATFARGFDIAADGRILAFSSTDNDYQLVVAPNWRTELRRRLAAAKSPQR